MVGSLLSFIAQPLEKKEFLLHRVQVLSMELILIFCLVAWIAFLAASLLALLVCRLRQLGLCGTVDGEFISSKNAVFCAVKVPKRVQSD